MVLKYLANVKYLEKWLWLNSLRLALKRISLNNAKIAIVCLNNTNCIDNDVRFIPW